MVKVRYCRNVSRRRAGSVVIKFTFLTAVLVRAVIGTNKKRHPKDGVFYLATSNGLEPSTSSVTGWRANRLHHEAIDCEELVLNKWNYSRCFGICKEVIFGIFKKSPDPAFTESGVSFVNGSCHPLQTWQPDR